MTGPSIRSARSGRALLILLATVLVVALSCKALRRATPILQVKEYERMIAGRLDADYVGTEGCLSSCHYHDELHRNFDASTMGAAMDLSSGMPQVDCESCHGPGSLAIASLTKEKVLEDTAGGVQSACAYDTLIDLKALPAPARSLICLKCHSGQSSFNLHNWASSTHAVAGLSCNNCHNVHIGPDLITSYEERSAMCMRCHERVTAQFDLPSRHPVRENKITCTDCHDPHGANERSLIANTIGDVCAQCHAEAAAPFAFAHADTMERCNVCHANHGSINDNLLNSAEPYLCMRCHVSHPPRGAMASSVVEVRGTFFTRCSDCHAAIHGSNIPAPSGRGTFLR